MRNRVRDPELLRNQQKHEGKLRKNSTGVHSVRGENGATGSVHKLEPLPAIMVGGQIIATRRGSTFIAPVTVTSLPADKTGGDIDRQADDGRIEQEAQHGLRKNRLAHR